MEYWEFCELTRQMVQQLLPRIPERYRDGFDLDKSGGEYAFLVEELVYTVVDDQIPVSRAELESLRALAGYFKSGAELVAMLEQVQAQE